MKYIKIISFLCFFSLIACIGHEQEADKYHWVETSSGIKIWVEIEDGYTYQWNGETWNNVAHGDGTLTIFDVNENVVKTKDVTAYYGAINSKGIWNVPGGKYIGESYRGTMSGKGILIKGNEIFYGSFRSSMPHGELAWYVSNRLRYTGSWSSGEFNGDGTLFKDDGSKSSGIWENGICKIKMTEYTDNTGKYYGYLENGVPSIRGTKLYNNGWIYDGEWVDGVWSGQGTFICANDTIIGHWKNGKLNGHAKYVSPEYVYEGEYVDNHPTGKGNVTFSNNTNYSGEWKNGQMIGTGQLDLGNGDKYVGELADNQFNGHGTYYFGTGEQYVGDWKNGFQNGEGKYTSKSFTYQGHWEEGWMNGKGRINYSNGDWYEGNFVENELYGVGTYHSKTGNRYVGEFIDGKINGLGTYYFEDGSVYEGEFEDGKIKGDGTMFCIVGNDTVAITAYWDGTNTFPKMVSMLFSNGDLYEGPIVNGQPTQDGVWTTVKNGGMSSTISNANEYYKTHKETIQKVVLITSLCLVGVTLLVATAGSGAPATILLIGKVANTTNTVINVADATTSIASLAVDGDYKEAGIETAKNVGVDIAFAIAPSVVKGAKNVTKAVLESNPSRKAAAKLSETAKRIADSKVGKAGKNTRKAVGNAAKKAGEGIVQSAIKISKTKPYQKVVKVVSDGAGGLKKVYTNTKKSAFDKIRKNKKVTNKKPTIKKPSTKKSFYDRIRDTKFDKKLTAKNAKKASKNIAKQELKLARKYEKSILNKNLKDQERLNNLEALRLRLEKLKETDPKLNEEIYNSLDKKTQKALDELNDAIWKSTPANGKKGHWAGNRGTSRYDLKPGSKQYEDCKKAGQTSCTYDKSGRPNLDPATEPNSIVDCSDLYDKFTAKQLKKRGGGNNIQDKAQERMAKQMESTIRAWWKQNHPREPFNLMDAFFEYRNAKNLVPHEDINGQIRLVNREVHKAFTHSGGISRINIVKRIDI